MQVIWGDLRFKMADKAFVNPMRTTFEKAVSYISSQSLALSTIAAISPPHTCMMGEFDSLEFFVEVY